MKTDSPGQSSVKGNDLEQLKTELCDECEEKEINVTIKLYFLKKYLFVSAMENYYDVIAFKKISSTLFVHKNKLLLRGGRRKW